MKRGMFGMITLERRKLRMSPDIFVENEMAAVFNLMLKKFIKPCWRRQKKWLSHPVMEAKLEAIVDRVIAEILERFPNGGKIYEIQNVVEHELLQANEYAIAESYITYRTQWDFERSKATDINFTIGKPQQGPSGCQWKCQYGTAMSLIRNGLDGGDRW